ncbi:PREDICTED: scopoletin glucosyltransferase [Theobroma cacao]|uniref:Glycosyltransferase n=1 Tax=Theobroma cacao TaxID=3641 RepID=A0AB32VJ16_THECC|nr:PREDICTED: scopoletin glucosyltransferase [Theobroma cacao]
MASKSRQLHIVFLPQLAHGILIPTVDMARLCARHGVKVTIATTPLNAHLFAKTIQRDRESGFEISTYIIKFPSAEVGLPEGCENASSLTSQEMQTKFLKAANLFQQPLEQLLAELRPDCLVAGMMFTWATDVASKFGIPRLVFHGTSCFSISIVDSVIRHAPYKKIATDFEFFDVPGLPDQIKMTKMQLPDFMKEEGGSERRKMMNEALESERISFGVIVNSFYELEPAYREHYSKVMGKKAWQVGPVSLCNKDSEDKAERGNVASIDRHECLRWLASKKPNSVLYICFGSLSRFSAAQLNEMAKGLEASGQNFIWVVRKVNDEDKEEWLPEGFEERMEGKGLIIRGWAPQVLILDHEAVGGFMTHCGWNSTLESITAGVPMVTWPLHAEQFFNEKLIVDVLKIGVCTGAKEWSRWADDTKIIVTSEDIQKAVTQLMVGEEGEKMRNRTRELKDMARRAVEEGGSSYSDLNALLDELRLNCLPK